MQIELVTKTTPIRKRERYQVRIVEEQNGEALVWSEKYADRRDAEHVIDLLQTKLPKAHVVEVED